MCCSLHNVARDFVCFGYFNFQACFSLCHRLQISHYISLSSSTIRYIPASSQLDFFQFYLSLNNRMESSSYNLVTRYTQAERVRKNFRPRCLDLAARRCQWALQLSLMATLERRDHKSDPNMWLKAGKTTHLCAQSAEETFDLLSLDFGDFCA